MDKEWSEFLGRLKTVENLYTLISGDNYVIRVDQSPDSLREILLAEPDHSIVEGSENYLKGKYQIAYQRKHAILLFGTHISNETHLQINPEYMMETLREMGRDDFPGIAEIEDTAPVVRDYLFRLSEVAEKNNLHLRRCN